MMSAPTLERDTAVALELHRLRSRLATAEHELRLLRRAPAPPPANNTLASELLAAVVRETTDAVFVKDLEGRYLLFNEAAARFVNRPIQDVLGQDDERLFTPESAGLIRERDLQVMRSGRAVTAEETLTAAGVTRTYLATKAPFRDRTGKIMGVIGVSRDITDRIRLEAELRQAQKVEAIGLLSAGIAHDFNNILGTIQGETDLAAQDLGPDHPVAPNLLEIHRAVHRAAALVRQILTFARRDADDRVPTDLRDVVTETARLLRATIPAGIEIVVALPEFPCFALAADSQIEQALLNLGTNAWHAIQSGVGRITLELTSLDPAAARQHAPANLADAACHRIRVLDTGHGMDAETLERIFDPFFTTKDPGKGTGLGLSVVHGIVENHHGTITVRSTLDVGTTFEVFLPATLPATPLPPSRMPNPSSAPPPSQPGSEQHVLVIDDEESLARVLGRALQRLGYRVTKHTTAHEALTEFSHRPESYHLVITDLNMPALSGLDVARRISGLRPDLPILLTSGFITDDIMADSRRAGVREVIRKPVDFAGLAAVVQRLLPRTDPPPSTPPGPPVAGA